MLNHSYIIDSARVGNETRYINHASDKDGKANATAKSARLQNNVSDDLSLISYPAMLVLGEPHIALYASTWRLSWRSLFNQDLHTARDIKAGGEILFDYGEAYWNVNR